jgi:excisionase family DNA binding protein
MKSGYTRSAASPAHPPALSELLKPVVDMIADAVAERLRRGEEPRLLTVREAARYLRRSERWIRNEVAGGNLQCVREGTGRPRFDRVELDRWIEERQKGNE